MQNGPSLAEVLKPGTLTDHPAPLSNPEIQSRLEQYLPQEHIKLSAAKGKASDRKARAPRVLGEKGWNKRYSGSISPATEADPLASNPAKLG